MNPIIKLDLTYDAERLWLECLYFIAQHGWGGGDQISLTHRPDISPEDRIFDGVGTLKTTLREKHFSVINAELQGTYIEEIIKFIPYKLGRVRIMRAKSRSCYSVHTDTTMRMHLPLLTNPQALMLFPDHNLIFHIPRDDHMYLTDTKLKHSAMNGGEQDRYHIVCALVS